MLFRILKAYAKFAIKIFCRTIVINEPKWLHAKGPLLLACNHPNSFLDGVILTILFKENMYALARGDAFRNKEHERLLRWLHLLPVYRTSEGMENLEHNYTTFEGCKQIFEQDGIVIIFSEGRCVNEWHLRTLKKGTARLATSCWLNGIDLTVVPVGLNYSTFRNFGKNVFINFGKPLNKETIMEHASDGKMFLSFNEQLLARLRPLVFEIDSNDKTALRRKLYVQQPVFKKIILAIPALTGFLLHAPLYFLMKALNNRYFNNDHFDSALVALLVLTYPFYLSLFCLSAALLFHWKMMLVVLFLMPFCAWSCVQLKNQSD